MILCLSMIYLAFEPQTRYLVIYHSSRYKFLRVKATLNFEELKPISGTSQCYGIISSSYLFESLIFLATLENYFIHIY